MTSVRFLTAAVLLCAASGFAQDQFSSWNRPSRTPDLEKSVRAPYKIDQFSIDPAGQPIHLDSQIDHTVVSLNGQPGDDTVCYKIRSYVVARDSQDSDAVHPVGYSTCQPASRYRLRRTQIQTEPSDR